MPDSPKLKTEADTTDWYYQLMGLSTGPITTERLNWMIENNHLAAASLIANSTDGPWQRLDESNFGKLIPAKPEPAAKPKPRQRTPSARSAKSTAVTPDADADEFVQLDGIEIEEPVEAEEEVAASLPVAAAPRVPEPANVRPSAPPILDDTDPATAEPDGASWDAFEAEVQPNPPPREAARPRQTRKEQPPVPAADRSRRKRYLLVAAGLALVALLAWFGPAFFGGSADSEKAYSTFRRVMDTTQQSSKTLDDTAWVNFLRERQAEVTAELEPLRAQANADKPELQALVWAGDQLLDMLKGTRESPPRMRVKFEAFMAEYSGEPIPEVRPSKASSDDVPSEEGSENRVMDPIF